jgi:hypothetical protein
MTTMTQVIVAVVVVSLSLSRMRRDDVKNKIQELFHFN